MICQFCGNEMRTDLTGKTFCFFCERNCISTSYISFEDDSLYVTVMAAAWNVCKALAFALLVGFALYELIKW
jgi:hypothetical protein